MKQLKKRKKSEMEETWKTALNKDQEKKMSTGWLQIKQSKQNIHTELCQTGNIYLIYILRQSP